MLKVCQRDKGKILKLLWRTRLLHQENSNAILSEHRKLGEEKAITEQIK
jgi:hypothetical protein